MNWERGRRNLCTSFVKWESNCHQFETEDVISWQVLISQCLEFNSSAKAFLLLIHSTCKKMYGQMCFAKVSTFFFGGGGTIMNYTPLNLPSLIAHIDTQRTELMWVEGV